MAECGIVTVFKNLSGNDHEIQFDSSSTKAVSSLLWAFVQLPAKAGIVPVVEQSATGISLPSFEPRSFGEFSPKTNPVSVSGHSELLLIPLWVARCLYAANQSKLPSRGLLWAARGCERIEREQQGRLNPGLESVRSGYNRKSGPRKVSSLHKRTMASFGCGKRLFYSKSSSAASAQSAQSMSVKYYEYLSSEAWKAKRLKRLTVDRFACAACGRKDYLQVHHLTYDRVYNEDIKDLLTLCELHHQAAEDLIKLGQIPRRGNPLELAHKTLSLICPGRTPCFNPGIECRNPVQQKLLSERWFLQLLCLPRKKFKRAIKARFNKYVSAKVMTNSMVIYQRCREQNL